MPPAKNDVHPMSVNASFLQGGVKRHNCLYVQASKFDVRRALEFIIDKIIVQLTCKTRPQMREPSGPSSVVVLETAPPHHRSVADAAGL